MALMYLVQIKYDEALSIVRQFISGYVTIRRDQLENKS